MLICLFVAQYSELLDWKNELLRLFRHLRWFISKKWRPAVGRTPQAPLICVGWA